MQMLIVVPGSSVEVVKMRLKIKLKILFTNQIELLSWPHPYSHLKANTLTLLQTAYFVGKKRDY